MEEIVAYRLKGEAMDEIVCLGCAPSELDGSEPVTRDQILNTSEATWCCDRCFERIQKTCQDAQIE